MHEWPMLLFSLLLQASIGLALVGGIFAYMIQTELKEVQCYKTMRSPMFMMCILGVLGLAASFAHLGYPLNAPNAILHIGSSWMSREILLTSIYIGLLCFIVFYAWRTQKVSSALLIIAGLVGLLNVVFMAGVYVHTFILPWAHINTYSMFLGATLALGSAMACMLIVPQQLSAAGWGRLVMVVLLLLVVSLIGRVLIYFNYLDYMSDAANTGSAVVTFASDPVVVFYKNAGLRYAAFGLFIVGLMLVFLVWLRKSSAPIEKQRGLLMLVGVLIIVAEAVLRYAFYDVVL